MTHQKFEYTIAYHCAPVLMGIKPSNLVSFSKQAAPELPELLWEYESALLQRGIHMEILCGCRSHYLVLVYRPELLEKTLREERIERLLIEYGYERSWTLMQKLRYLSRQFESRKGVPHEIGAFLGYPIEDILGFCEHKGEACKLCGYWKVYGDAAAAKAVFEAYDRCRELLTGMLAHGMSMLQSVDLGIRQLQEAA